MEQTIHHEDIFIDETKAACVSLLSKRGIAVEKIAALTYLLQAPYDKSLTEADCAKALDDVLSTRSVQYAVLTGLYLDMAGEQGSLLPILNGPVQDDAPLYDVDETLGLSIAQSFGNIALTSFGYLDQLKPGLVGELDQDADHCHTFADDLVSALASAAAAQLAKKLHT